MEIEIDEEKVDEVLQRTLSRLPTNTTVLSALNEIGGGHAVWLYKESKCDKHVMSLSWPIR